MLLYPLDSEAEFVDWLREPSARRTEASWCPGASERQSHVAVF
jgi:hypothetical protein